MSGDKTPWWVEKGVPNPMKNPETRKKASISIRKTFKDKNIGEIISKIKKGKKTKPMSEAAKKVASERMKKNNPMKNPEIVSKMKKSYRKTVSKENYIHPNRGRKRPDAKKRMESENNPMKNYETARIVWEKAKNTIRKNGNISEGQKRLYDLLDSLKIKYEKEKYFKINNQNIGWAYADAYIPKLNLIIEYDGIQSHYSAKGSRYDTRRDRQLRILYRVSVIRLSRDTVFAENFIDTLKEAINEIKMEKNPIRKKIGGY